MEVHYRYYRVPEWISKPSTNLIKPQAKGMPKYACPYLKSEPPFRPHPKGGGVECIIELNGIAFVGVSVCSMSDNFNYKVGRQIAYGRALKKIERFYTPKENK